MFATGSTVKVENLLGSFGRDLLDIHSAFGRNDEGDARTFAVDEQRKIELALNRSTFLDVETVHFLTGGPGLMRDERGAEEPLGLLLHVVD